MIELIMNGTPHKIDPPTSSELGAEIRALLPEGQEICQVKVNGFEVPIAQLDEFEPAAIRGLEVSTATPAELARGAVGETREWIGRICSALDAIAQDYRDGREAQGASRLIETVDALNVLIHLLAGIRQHLVLEEEIRVRIDAAWQEAEGELLQAVNALVEGIESGDPLRLADQAGHVLPRCLSSFQALLDEVSN